MNRKKGGAAFPIQRSSGKGGGKRGTKEKKRQNALDREKGNNGGLCLGGKGKGEVFGKDFTRSTERLKRRTEEAWGHTVAPENH